MATYVLVPGAWLGGWAWRGVAARLRAKGHDVYPITLTGLGERVHLARPEVDLETHITDVVNTMQWNDLQDVILAGHSYAGIVVTGVADRIPDRIQQLVYVDSAPFADGMAMTDLYPPDALAALRQAVDQTGDGWRWPFPGFEELAKNASLAGLGGPERAWIAAKAVAQPWATYTQPLHLRHAGPGTAVPYTVPARGDRL
jgi:pimeloyl-ACP methyl ester carboxylesterase